MFSHRVLPAPSSTLLPEQYHHHHQLQAKHQQDATRRDSLLVHRIMTREERRVEGADKSDSYQIASTTERPSTENHLEGRKISTRSEKASEEQHQTRSQGQLNKHQDISQQEGGEEDTSQVSQVSRKRPSSRDSEIVEDPEVDYDEIEHEGSTRHDSVSGQSIARSRLSDTPSVCLCQPDPKVPRPRNAFILFRQHHQSEVAKANPGAANPEISKIIGEYWRQASVESKNRWKALADEEKARHQKQYPNYRYQPRRAGRKSDSLESETGRCAKCGGRSMAARLPTPSGPHPGTPIGGRHPSTPLTASIRNSSYPIPVSPHHRASYSRGPGPYYDRPHRDSGYGSSSLPSYIQPPRHGEDIDQGMMSPDAKRRRFESGYLPGATRAGSIANAMHAPYGRRGSTNLPRPEFMGTPVGQSQRSISVTTAPRTTAAGPVHPTSPAQSELRLAPIKTGSQSNHTQTQAQFKAVEAMVMSIPPLNKVRVLSKISPPLQLPGAASPPHGTRGAIIAVEGQDEEALKQVITCLRDGLMRENECKVRLFYGGRFGGRSSSERKTDGSYGSVSAGFEEWLGLIGDWHRESQEVRKFITTSIPLPGSSPPAPTSSISPNLDSTRDTGDKHNTSPQISPRTTRSKTHAPLRDPDSMDTTQDTPKPSSPAYKPSSPSHSNYPALPSSPAAQAKPHTRQLSTSSNPPYPHSQTPRPRNAPPPSQSSGIQPSADSESTSSSAGPMPIAIIPRFQLSLTDTAASAVPIADEYSPTDHWQWMATLWRGIIGPDVTVVIRPRDSSDETGGATPVVGPGGGPGGGLGGGHSAVGLGGGHGLGGIGATDSKPPAGSGTPSIKGSQAGEHPRGPDVEIRLHDARAVVLRCDKDGRIPDGALRRMGFEVSEWLRGLGEKGRR